MVKHIVMFKIADEAFGMDKEALKLEIKTRVDSLKGQIEGMIDLEVGLNSLPDPQAFDVVLVCSFDDEAAFEYYKTHPKHVEVVKFIGEVKTDRAVVDYFL